MTITLLDGSTIDAKNITFDAASYHFFDSFNGEDLTYNIRLTDKEKIVPGFDRVRWFNLASKEVHPASETELANEGKTTFDYFAEQITTDPLSAPLATLDKASKQLTENKTIRTLVVIAGIGLAIYALSTLTKATSLVKG